MNHVCRAKIGVLSGAQPVSLVILTTFRSSGMHMSYALTFVVMKSLEGLRRSAVALTSTLLFSPCAFGMQAKAGRHPQLRSGDARIADEEGTVENMTVASTFFTS